MTRECLIGAKQEEDLCLKSGIKQRKSGAAGAVLSNQR